MCCVCCFGFGVFSLLLFCFVSLWFRCLVWFGLVWFVCVGEFVVACLLCGVCGVLRVFRCLCCCSVSSLLCVLLLCVRVCCILVCVYG